MSNVITYANNAKETATTTGTGTFTLAGAVANCVTFTSVLSNGDVVPYRIQHATAAEWEIGFGTFTSAGTTLARTTVVSSSNSDNAVNFSAGTKYVSIVTNKSWLNAINQGRFIRELAADAAASDVRVSRLFYADAAIRILTLAIECDADVTADNTNYKTFDIKKYADGGAIGTGLATQILTTVAGGGFTARTKRSFTLTGSKIDLSAGDILVLDVGIAAGGVQLPQFEVIGTFKPLF